MQPSDPYGLAGQVLDGQFRVDRPIGEGGFSVVYRGKHLGLGEPIAIKCLKLPPRLGSAIVENFVRRFRDESKIQYKLSQASLHVARTIAAGTAMAPSVNALVPFMVLEWLDGYPLAEELRARRGRGEGGRPLADVVRLLDPVAEALAMAHGMGVVHRDLNPSNIFLALDASGAMRPKVMDFGVAKVVSDHALALGPRTATLNQLRLFTPPYGAPEQFDDRVGPVGTWTDVYSFALVVVELLTDRTPNEGDSLLDLMAHACDATNRPTPRARGVAVSDAVEEVFARALSVDPGKRPGDVGEFWGNLKHVASGHGGRPSAPGHTAKGTFILTDPPPVHSSPPTPPAFALPLSKPAHGGPPATVTGSSWAPPPPPPAGAGPWPTPANGTAAWTNAPSPSGSWASPPPNIDRASPSDSWAVAPANLASPSGPRGAAAPADPASPSGSWAAAAPADDVAATQNDTRPWGSGSDSGAGSWGAEVTVSEGRPPKGQPPQYAARPPESLPSSEPPSHVDPFGPTAEGDGGRPGASPLSTTVKPGEKRPDFFFPGPGRPAAPTPGAGVPATVPARRPAPTPGTDVPPLRTPAPTPGSGVGQAPSGPYVPPAASSGPAPVAPNASPYGPLPPGQGPSYTPAPTAGSSPYSPGPPPHPPPGGTPYPAAYALPPGLYSGRPAPPDGAPGYGLPSGQVPLRPLEGGIVPVAPTPSNLPPEPLATGGRVKPLLAWLAVAFALITALAGLAYLVTRYLRRG